MKKHMYVFLCTVILLGLPNVTGFIVKNNLYEIKNVSVDDNVPIWELGDSWTYDINRFQINFSASSALLGLDSAIDDLTLEMIGYSETSYILKLSGKIRGSFQYESGEGIALKGNLYFARISGNMYFRQNDLASEKLSIFINGIALLHKHPFQIPISIPIPLKITININQSTPRSFIDFPLYDGKQGFINETGIYANIKFESIFLQILSLFFADIPNEISYQETFDISMFDYLAKNENLSVGAGTFNSYNISFSWGLFGSIFYAPNVGNYIKAESVIDIPNQFMILIMGELKSYNYQ
jgi:hypothetical protein